MKITKITHHQTLNVYNIYRPFLIIIIGFLFMGVTSGATITSTSSGGNWSAAGTWVGGVIPTTSDIVIIPSTATVTVNINATISKLDVFGTLNVKDGITLTVKGDVIIESTGTFSMPGGSGNATLIVYGNYTTNGVSDFWKSDVIVAGDFISPNTTGVQNIGNLIVGGNIIGNIDLTGGNGTNQIYALNPNATVSITPASVNTTPTISSPPESSSLLGIVNTVIYGSASPCGYTINGPINTTMCLAGTASFIITSTTATSPTYQWEENAGTSWTSLSNGGYYSGVTTATLTISGAPISMNGYIYRCKITNNTSCSKYSYSATLTVSSTPAVGTPVFTLGATSTRCQGAGSVTYTAAATNNTGLTYSLDASSLAAGNSINAGTGAVTYTAGWSGTSIVTVSASGCSGPKTASHTITITPSVGTPIFTLGTTSTRCQGAGSITYNATASNSTGITYSLDAASQAAGNSINTGTGAVTYTAGWNGTSVITATAAGCGGPKTASHTVTINPLPAAITGSTEVCTGLTTTLSSLSGGGSWTSSAPAIATINVSGIVTGLSLGNSLITYTLPTGCYVTTTITVSLTPDTGPAYRTPNN